MKNELFNVEIGNGIYLISSTGFGTELKLGRASANSYLVVGEREAVLVDLTLRCEGIRKYAEQLAGKPMRTVITHCHPDHIYCISEFEKVYFHQEDRDFPLCNLPGMTFPEKLPEMSYLSEGDILELGGRSLLVFHIPGHSKGSILLLDNLTGTLFSGDTVARRLLLYGVAGAPELDRFKNDLRRLENFPISHIQSAHDRADLSKGYISHMIKLIETELPTAEKRWKYPGLPEMVNLIHGTEDSPDFFDCAFPDSLLQSYSR